VIAISVKFVGLVLTTIWTWGENSRHCRDDASSLFPQANNYLIGVWSVFGFQMIFGTFFLLCCGLDGAIHESSALIRQDYGTEQREDFDDDIDETENQKN